MDGRLLTLGAQAHDRGGAGLAEPDGGWVQGGWRMQVEISALSVLIDEVRHSGPGGAGQSTSLHQINREASCLLPPPFPLSWRLLPEQSTASGGFGLQVSHPPTSVQLLRVQLGRESKHGGMGACLAHGGRPASEAGGSKHVGVHSAFLPFLAPSIYFLCYWDCCYTFGGQIYGSVWRRCAIAHLRGPCLGSQLTQSYD